MRPILVNGIFTAAHSQQLISQQLLHGSSFTVELVTNSFTPLLLMAPCRCHCRWQLLSLRSEQSALQRSFDDIKNERDVLRTAHDELQVAHG